MHQTLPETTPATQRAAMPQGTNAVLDRRTVFHDNKNLLPLVHPGNRVLDVGCGSGAITSGIGALTGETGRVVGIDPSEHLIALATSHYAQETHVRFEVADINTYSPADKFDVVSAARTLQWLANPEAVLQKMVDLLKPGGYLTILDYNHDQIEWTPAIPESMQGFYQAFLKWRKDAGMDNGIADKLAILFEKLGLKNITVTDQSELSVREEEAFIADVSIWLKVAETRGKQLVSDGYLTEAQRITAIDDYRQWTETQAQSMKMYLLAVTGQK
jgi:ubiquinone/menaquinone biosynthesis C-methylase UbiE